MVLKEIFREMKLFDQKNAIIFAIENFQRLQYELLEGSVTISRDFRGRMIDYTGQL